MSINQSDAATSSRLPGLLLDLARRQDQLAAEELASASYWSPGSESLLGHRAAAAILCAEANLLLAAP